ncbi:MAG: CapA family protein [Anaerolineae bacterium]|nr:CapA family protein [Anaerolineae bacterium]
MNRNRFVIFLLIMGCCCRALPASPDEGFVPPEGNALSGGVEAATEGPLTLILAGDIMLGRGVAQALDGEWKAAFAGVLPWPEPGPGSEPILVIANLESPLTARPQLKEGYDLRAPPEAVTALRAAGIDALSLANNHALDAGQPGLSETASVLQAAGIAPWLDETPTAMAPSLYGLALDDSAIPLDIAAAAEAVAAAAAHADVVVVSIHWGSEYQAAPSPRQQAIAAALADAGATVIAGHGPHVLQRVEWLGRTLVAYSLGNFLFDQLYPADCRWGALLQVTVQGADIVAVEAIPTVIEEGRVRRADAETAERIMDRLELRALSARGRTGWKF